MRVTGSSRFAGAAVLANTRGLSAVAPTALDSSSQSLLDVARSTQSRSGGIGISSRARNFNQSVQGGAATVFAFSASSVDSARIQILGLRSQAAEGSLSRDFAADAAFDESAEPGSNVDIEA